MTVAPTRLLFVRHGESRSNTEGWISGPNTCGGLTDVGVRQAELLRDRLARLDSLRPDVVLSSTMPRAARTAEIIAAGTGVAVEQRVELSERFPGECEGMNFQRYATTYGRVPFADWTPALSPGGEDNATFTARVEQAVAEVVGAHSGLTVWIVCHGGIILGATSLLMRVEGGAASPRWYSPANTSLTEFCRAHDREHWSLVRYNDHAHLERDALTTNAVAV